MPEFDWMTDPSFRNEIESAVSRAAAIGGMTHYQPGIAEQLMVLLGQHRQPLIENELAKSSILRKNKSDAMSSVQTLVMRASEIAAQDRRTIVEVRDFDTAYREKFCMVWPFCGRG